MRAASPLLAALLLAGAVAAQGNDLPGCIQGNPCEVIVNLDSAGIRLEQETFTRGDWVLLSVFNDDDVEHTLAVPSKGITVTLVPGDINDTRPFELDAVGSVVLRDSPTNDTAEMVVEDEEEFTASETEPATGIPGPQAPLAAAAVAAALLAWSRRR